MKNSVIGLLFILLPAITGYSQYFSVRDIELGYESYLEPASIKNLEWSENPDTYIYSDDSMLYMASTTGDNVLGMLSLKELNKSLFLSGIGELTSFPKITTLDGDQLNFKLPNCQVIYSIRDKHAYNFIVPDSAGNLAFNPRMQSIAYTLGNNIFIQDSLASVFQITHDSVDGIKNGDIVFRSEFGIEKGLCWSPQGNYLAYYRKDETFVTNYPLVTIQSRIARLKTTRYPMAGMKSEESDVFIYSMDTKSSVKLQISGDREQYHTNLSWLPDESALYIQHLNRDQDTMVLKSYSAITGEPVKVLFMETNARYVEPQNPIVFSKLAAGNFFYQSQRDGYNHLYYYNAAQGKLEQLTSGPWEVTKFLGFNESEQAVFFMANRDNPLEDHLYKLDRISGEIFKLTTEPGTHLVKLNTNRTCFIDDYSNFTTPRKIQIRNTDGDLMKDLLTAPCPFQHIELGEVVTGTMLAADDSTILYYQLTKPVNFRKSKKYPVVIYVYGGTHLQLITNAWMDRTAYFQQYLAQHGIASFMLDSRGSDKRGMAFESCIHRQSGLPQLADQMRGIDFLKSLSFIDTSRIGVHGWSYGGFMTLTMMVSYPEVFKVGVAGGPVTDWKYYEVMYGERYMDRPEQNPEGYAKTSLINKAGNLQGKLLIIHGGIDPVVVPQQSLLFLQEGIVQGKDIDYFVYPTHEHNVMGKDRVHLAQKITSYFIDNL
jgi:dipeptidyl-peptidase 4